MMTADLDRLELREVWYEADPAMRIRVNFPFFAATGNESSAVVYFEIEPGHYLGTHTDSAEEIVLLLAGTVEASLGDETGRLTAGQSALIPAMVPHGIRNIGQETARCVGFFAAATVESTFDQPLMPMGEQRVGTPPAGRERGLGAHRDHRAGCAATRMCPRRRRPGMVRGLAMAAPIARQEAAELSAWRK